MGKTPGELEAEIENLRRETEAILEELERRASVPNLLHGAAEAVADRAGLVLSEVGSEMPEVVRDNPPLFGGAALGGLAALGVLALSAVALGPRNRAAERAFERGLTPPSRVDEIGARIEEALAGILERAKEGHDLRMAAEREKPGMLKRVMWLALAGGMAALGSVLFKQLGSQLRRGARGEEPPRE